MKTLKFKAEFVKEVLEGRKTTTWRLFDDKNLQKNDTLELIDRDSHKSFAKGVITDIQEKKIQDLSDEELRDHGYGNVDDMLTSHRVYYGDKVDLETEVKMLTFRLV